MTSLTVGDFLFFISREFQIYLQNLWVFTQTATINRFRVYLHVFVWDKHNHMFEMAFSLISSFALPEFPTFLIEK